MDERQHLPLRRLHQHRHAVAPRRGVADVSLPLQQSNRRHRLAAGVGARTRRRHHTGGPHARDGRAPEIIDINALPYRDIDLNRPGCGSVRWCGCQNSLPIRRSPTVPGHPQALELSASAQLRNMASIGGNLMQRPRCLYFRDVTAACNRRPGCRLRGDRRPQPHPRHPRHQRSAWPPTPLTWRWPGGTRRRGDRAGRRRGASDPDRRILPAARHHTDQEHTCAGELIIAVEVPVPPEARRSGYLKVRDRESYEFALTSAAVGLDIPAAPSAGRGWPPAGSAPSRGVCPPLRVPRSGGRPSRLWRPRLAPPTVPNPSPRTDSRWSCSNEQWNVSWPRWGPAMTHPAAGIDRAARLPGRRPAQSDREGHLAADNVDPRPGLRRAGRQHRRARHRRGHRQRGAERIPRCCGSSPTSAASSCRSTPTSRRSASRSPS